MKDINLISLARCPERHELMIRQFAETGLGYRYIEAVDGKDDSTAEDWEVDTEAFRKIYGREIRAGEIGCYASHLKALDAVVGHEADYGIVMEDDVIINPEFDVDAISMWVSECVRQAPKGWSLIYPGNPLMWGSHRYKRHIEDHQTQESFNQNVHWEGLEELTKALIGTQCYIISSDFAHHVLTHWNTIYRPIDEVYRVLCLDPRFSFFHAPRKGWWCRPNWEIPSEIRG